MLPVKNFTDFIAQNNLFAPGDKILAAVSGGMDSVVMVHLLKAAGYNFGIAHCNFQLRGDEATSDQQFCKNLADEVQIPFHTINFDTSKFAADNKISIQMAARQLRYDWFEQVRQQAGYTAIALAHHQNDAIETILLNLTRGTGIAGLHGILPKNGWVVRPLLFLGRDDIQKIITDNNLSYQEDSSNSSVKYARNKIRLNVIPQLKELNPSLEQTFECNLERFRDLELLLEHKIAEIKEISLVTDGDEIHLSIKEIKKLQPQKLLLFKLLQDYGFNETAVEDVILSLDKHPGRTFESKGYLLVLDRDKLILTPKNNTQTEAIRISETDTGVNFTSFKLNLLHDDSALIIKDNPMATSVDSSKLIYPLTLRTWQQGDYFYPIGMKTRKKLSDFFIGQKLPLHQKNEIPILVNGNNEIIWIGGHRPDDRYKVTENTKKVTIFELVNLKIR